MTSHRRNSLLTIGFACVAFLFSAWMSRAEGHGQTISPAAPITSATGIQDKPVVVEKPRPTGSLWNKGSRSLTEDVRAHSVGDTITIIVQETASASSTATTKTSKDESADFGGGTGLLRGLLRDFGLGAKTSMNGQGLTNRSGSLVTKMTAMIKEVLPNGNLVIEGVRTVGVNNEKQKIIISGTVRPQDINPDNTVSSIALANATVQYDGKGPVGERQRKGIISTIFSWLF
jgi:flagellar L-ring protein FlgH